MSCKTGWATRSATRALLQLALTHPSVAHEQGAPVQTNQRLEFLGDAVLQLVLTRELYEKFPAFGEGPLTKARAKLVNRRTLAERARHLGLGQHLIVSRGEELHGGRERPFGAGRHLRGAARRDLPRRRIRGGPRIHSPPIPGGLRRARP